MKITSDTVITEHITSGGSYEYDILSGAHATLVFTMIDMKPKTQTNVAVRLRGRGARATIIGVAVGIDLSSLALHTLQHHIAPETTSNLLVKGVFRDHATFLYDGAIRVEKRAQKTDAYQRNENLLLSRTAFAESKPTLEILADDVRCTHGATICSIPEDQLWYLASRGIEEKEAGRMLVTGFLESALSGLPDKNRASIVNKIVRAV